MKKLFILTSISVNYLFELLTSELHAGCEVVNHGLHGGHGEDTDQTTY